MVKSFLLQSPCAALFFFHFWTSKERKTVTLYKPIIMLGNEKCRKWKSRKKLGVKRTQLSPKIYIFLLRRATFRIIIFEGKEILGNFLKFSTVKRFRILQRVIFHMASKERWQLRKKATKKKQMMNPRQRGFFLRNWTLKLLDTLFLRRDFCSFLLPVCKDSSLRIPINCQIKQLKSIFKAIKNYFCTIDKQIWTTKSFY